VVDKVCTSKCVYEVEEKQHRVWSDENVKVVRGLLWCKDTSHPEWSCFVGRDQHVALTIHGLLVCLEASCPCHLFRVPGRAKVQVVVGKHILR
jgi:hypothetical protein